VLNEYGGILKMIDDYQAYIGENLKRRNYVPMTLLHHGSHIKSPWIEPDNRGGKPEQGNVTEKHKLH
jgi:hypothetical protein